MTPRKTCKQHLILILICVWTAGDLQLRKTCKVKDEEGGGEGREPKQKNGNKLFERSSNGIGRKKS